MTDEFFFPGDLSPEEANKTDFLVCVPVGTKSHFTDNLEGVCHDCGQAVIYRPDSPTKPPKICLKCFSERMLGGTA